MKLFIAIAVGLAIVALIQAQVGHLFFNIFYFNVNLLNKLLSQDDANETEELISPLPPSEEVISPRPEGRPPGRPGRPFRRPFGHRGPRPQPEEDEQADSGNPDNNPPQGLPPRRPVFFDINYDFGKHNIIRGSRGTSTAAP